MITAFFCFTIAHSCFNPEQGNNQTTRSLEQSKQWGLLIDTFQIISGRSYGKSARLEKSVLTLRGKPIQIMDNENAIVIEWNSQDVFGGSKAESNVKILNWGATNQENARLFFILDSATPIPDTVKFDLFFSHDKKYSLQLIRAKMKKQ